MGEAPHARLTPGEPWKPAGEGRCPLESRLGRKIAEGACADIYEWNGGESRGGRVLKLSKAADGRSAMAAEFHASRIVWEMGLSVPRPLEMVEVDGRVGIVFERVVGENGLERLIRWGMRAEAERWFDNFRAMARVLAEVHRRRTQGLPSQRDRVRRLIQRNTHLEPNEREALIEHLGSLPRSEQLCHGDPNPANFIFDDGGSATLIDWRDAASGNPEADLAKLVVMIRRAVLPAELPPELSARLAGWRERIAGELLTEYERLTGIGSDRIGPWLPLAAACRMVSDRPPQAEKEILLGEVRRFLGGLSQEV